MSEAKPRDLFLSALPAWDRILPVDVHDFTRGVWRTWKPLPLPGAAA